MKTAASAEAPIACTLEAGERVRELVCREQQCCGFPGFDLRMDQGSVTLVIEAPEGAFDARDAIFEPFLLASGQREVCACATASGRTGADNDGN